MAAAGHQELWAEQAEHLEKFPAAQLRRRAEGANRQDPVAEGGKRPWCVDGDGLLHFGKMPRESGSAPALWMGSGRTAQAQNARNDAFSTGDSRWQENPKTRATGQFPRYAPGKGPSIRLELFLHEKAGFQAIGHTAQTQSPQTMKTNSVIAWQLPSLAAGVLLSLAPLASAAVVEKEEPAVEAGAVKEEIVATGTVFSVEPDMLSVVMKDNPTPVRFAYSKDTPFVDEKGEAVPVDLVRAELPLTVHYEMEGEKMVARRVVVSRSMVAGDTNEKPDQKRLELAEKKAVETSRAADAEPYLPKEIMGTVSTIEQTISIVARGETTPTICIINNSTRYVNVSGQPVSAQLVMPGMPITVKTVRDGRRVIAQEIIVRGNPATLKGSKSATQDGSNPAQNRQGTTNTSGTGGGTGYILPNQILPPSAGPNVPSTPANPNSPVTPANPNSPGQPGAPGQPDVEQPNVTPAGGDTLPAGGTPPPGGKGSQNPATSGTINPAPRAGTGGSGNR